LTIFIVAFAGSQEPIPFERRKEFKSEALWNLLASPKFKTLQGKIQVTVFLPEGSRSWEMNLWADENRSRVQFELPHPEGRRQIITFTSPSEVWVWLPFAKKALRAEGSGFPSWRDMWQIRTDKLDMAKANYTLRLVGRDRVAERFCLVLQLEPKAKGNAIRKVWVHPPTRLPLQVERYSPDGQLEIRIAFTEVKINEPLPLLILEPSVPSDWTVENLPLFQRRRVDIGQAREVLGFEPILPSWLPQGYILEGIFALGDQRWKMAHIVYTDGIGVISVFQHPAPPRRKPPAVQPPFVPPRRPSGPPLTERPHHGAPFGGAPPAQLMFPQRIVIRDIGNLRVVLVSEVAREWLERMANSMTPTAAAR
jgi:hypothetical protein